MLHRVVPLIVLLASATALADEGMWTYDSFPAARVPGFAPDAKWLDHARLSSARLSGCSASFVSAEGLVMTNAHCTRTCVQDLSTAARDYSNDGFLARTRPEEVRCPAEHLDQLVAITDVTARVTGAVKGMTGVAYAQGLVAERGRIEKECQTDARTICETVSLYRGGLYHLYRYRRWEDVRLVFAPETAVSFFGGDPDNYEFPRWNLDVSFLRIYEDGKPARSPAYFRWAKAGARDGDTVFISGHPGQTSRGMTVAQMAQQRDMVLPEDLMLQSEQRGFLEEFQRRGDEERRVASAKLLSITNNLKRQRGQRRLLIDPTFFAARVAEENELRAEVDKHPELKARAGGAWDAIAGAVAANEELRRPFVALEGGLGAVMPKGFDSKLFFFARILLRGAAERARPSDERLREYADAGLSSLETDLFTTAPISPELEIATLTFSLSRMREELGADHPVVRRLLGTETPAALAARVVRGSRLASVEERRRLWTGATAIDPASDPMLALAASVDPDARAVRAQVEERIDGVLARNGELIAAARFALRGTSVAPDGTFTLRLAYGRVRSLPGVPAVTTLGGMFERATGTEPLALPKRWLDARPRLDMTMPFNVIATPDTTGGNSGSPVINTRAEVVGIYFDQNNWGTGSAFGYDEGRRRGVYLSAEAILHVLDKIYGAAALVKEIRTTR